MTWGSGPGRVERAQSGNPAAKQKAYVLAPHPPPTLPTSPRFSPRNWTTSLGAGPLVARVGIAVHRTVAVGWGWS